MWILGVFGWSLDVGRCLGWKLDLNSISGLWDLQVLFQGPNLVDG